MGKQKGFTGEWVTLCALMLALAKRVKPMCLFHECTKLFPFEVLQMALAGYTDHHVLSDPSTMGVPVRRCRSYDAVIKHGYEFTGNLQEQMSFFHTQCKLDASVWLQAPPDEIMEYKRHLAEIAMLSAATSSWRELLPVSARTHLQSAESWGSTKKLLADGCEVAMNLDQNPFIQPHLGQVMPCLLASGNHMRFGFDRWMLEGHDGRLADYL